MRVLGIIPARAGSKSIRNKNTALVAGRPLIEYTFDAALKSCWLNRVVVTSDCDRVKEIAANYPGIEIIHRPSELAQDETPIVPVLQHALSIAGEEYQAVALLQPTCPMRRACDIDMACQLMQANGASSIISYVDVGANHPARMVAMDGRVPLPLVKGEEWSNKQDLLKVYLRSGDIYLTRVECLLKGDLVGDKARATFIAPERHCNIDRPFDLKVAELLLTEERERTRETALASVGDYLATRE